MQVWCVVRVHECVGICAGVCECEFECVEVYVPVVYLRVYKCESVCTHVWHPPVLPASSPIINVHF